MQVIASSPSPKMVQNCQLGFTATSVTGRGEKSITELRFKYFFLKQVGFVGGEKKDLIFFEKCDKVRGLH